MILNLSQKTKIGRTFVVFKVEGSLLHNDDAKEHFRTQMEHWFGFPAYLLRDDLEMVDGESEEIKTWLLQNATVLNWEIWITNDAA